MPWPCPLLLLALAGSTRALAADEPAVEDEPIPVPDGPPPAPKGRDIPRYAPGEWKHVPVDPRFETDYTAYTVEHHLVRVGTTNLDYGLLDNAQVGTSPWLWLFGVANARAKVTAIQTDKVDVALEAGAAGLVLPQDNGSTLRLYSYPITVTGSWILDRGFSVHGGWRWEQVDVQGAFDLDTLAVALANGLGLDLEQELSTWLDGTGALYGGAHVGIGQARLGVDIRLNRRDSIIVLTRRYMTLRGRVDAGYATDDESLTAGAAVHVVEPLDGYFGATTTLAWQFTWPRVRLRFGIPINGEGALPMLWIPQAFELYLLL